MYFTDMSNTKQILEAYGVKSLEELYWIDDDDYRTDNNYNKWYLECMAEQLEANEINRITE